MADNAPGCGEENAQEEAIQAMLRRVEQRVRRELSVGGQTLDQIEEKSQSIGQGVKQIAEEESFRAGGMGYGGAYLPCRRGHPARYAGLRSRLLLTRRGIRTLRRAYYHCGACGNGWGPTDQTLGLG